MTGYAEHTDGWEDWRLDYRLGLILILPPQHVSDLIDHMRRKYDPKSHAICPTHISVSDPLSHEMTPDLEMEIRSILKTIEPFELHFDRLEASGEHPGVSYPIHPAEPIRELRNALHESGAFSRREYHRRQIPPHMTIAEFISIEDSLNLCSKLRDTAPKGSFLCDRLEFVVPDDDLHFQRDKTFLLGPSG